MINMTLHDASVFFSDLVNVNFSEVRIYLGLLSETLKINVDFSFEREILFKTQTPLVSVVRTKFFFK